MSRGKPRRLGPRAIVGFKIKANGKQRNIAQGEIAKTCFDLSPTNPHLHYICDFKPPETGHPRRCAYNPIEDRSNRIGPFLWNDPRDRHGCIENEAHRRPVSRSRRNSFRSKLRCPETRARMRSAAALASARSTNSSFGTSRATRRPWRVIEITSPFSTRSSKDPRVFFASNAPTSTIWPHNPA